MSDELCGGQRGSTCDDFNNFLPRSPQCLPATTDLLSGDPVTTHKQSPSTSVGCDDTMSFQELKTAAGMVKDEFITNHQAIKNYGYDFKSLKYFNMPPNHQELLFKQTQTMLKVSSNHNIMTATTPSSLAPTNEATVTTGFEENDKQRYLNDQYTDMVQNTNIPTHPDFMFTQTLRNHSKINIHQTHIPVLCIKCFYISCICNVL